MGIFILWALIYIGTLWAVYTYWRVLFWNNVKKYGKTAVFPRGYG